MPQSCDVGQMSSLPLRRKPCCGFLRPKYPTALTGIFFNEIKLYLSIFGLHYNKVLVTPGMGAV
jgi:hypothetical protein